MFTALLDVKFDRLITRELLSVIYAIAAGVVVLAGVVGAIALALSGFGGVMAALFLVIPLTVVNLLLVRVGTEAIVVYFRLGEDVRALRDAGLPLAA
jgi:hypothetical protein